MDVEISPLTCTSEQLFIILAGRNRSLLLLALSNRAMNEDHVVALLRNPSITPEIIHAIADRYDWSSSHKVQFSIVNCPKTPHALALRLLQTLFWNELVKTSSNYKVSPSLRRAAENHLKEKLVSITLGEKMSLARTAPRAVIPMLRNESETLVVSALLQNPNMVEDDVVAMITSERTPDSVLMEIGKDRKWSLRYSVQVALVRNENTPLPVALHFLSKLRKQDLEALVVSPKTAELIRRSAERILGGDY